MTENRLLKAQAVTRRKIKSLILPLLVFVLGSFALIFFGIWQTSRVQDEHAIKASEGLFQSLLNTEKEFLERLTVHYAIRHQPHTDPVENASGQVHMSDIGPYFHEMYKLSGTYIQGGDGKTLYALENKQKSDVQLHTIMPEIELALLQARQNYNDGAGFSGVSDYIKRPDGRLFIIGAAVMAPATLVEKGNAKPEQDQLPILVLTKELDDAFIDTLASRFALPEFSVVGTIPERDGVTASVELKSEGGLTAGWLVWKPELKSREFVQLSLQSIALALLLLFVLMGLILIRTFRLFRFLDRQHHENNENALKVREYEQAISVLARGNFVNESAVFEAVETIAKNTADALAIDRMAIWQFDEKNDVLRSLCRYDSRLRKFMKSIELPVCDHPEFFEAFFKGEEIQIKDSQNSILMEKMNPLFYKKGERVSVLAEPILRRGKVVGLISFANWQVDYPWSEEEFQFIRSNVTIVSLVLDTYARSLIEKELRRAKNKAEAANLAKSEFLANMSHELRTPLNAVIGFSDLMMQKIYGDLGSARYEDYIGDINMSARHLLSLINEVLDVAKTEAGKLEIFPEDVDIVYEFSNAIRLLKGRFRDREFSVDTSIEEDIHSVFADPKCFRQIILNILTNAVKFSKDDCQICVDVRKQGEFVALSFEDNGIGIPADQLKEVFTAFHQVENALNKTTEGTGLGLSITKALVEMHKGKIEIDSVPGQGTTIRILLPIARPADQTDSADAA